MGTWADRLATLRRDATDKTDKTLAPPTEDGVLSVLSAQSRREQHDPFTRWRVRNAERLTANDVARGYDAGGYCAEHGRRLSYPEQKRGACSWCVPVDPQREAEYWHSHWRRFTGQP